MAPFLVLVGSFLGFIVMVISTLLFFKTRPQKSAIARRSWIILAPLRKSSNCKILHISFFGIEVSFQQNPGLIGSKHETFPPEDICNDFKNDVFFGIQKLVTLFFVTSWTRVWICTNRAFLECSTVTNPWAFFTSRHSTGWHICRSIGIQRIEDFYELGCLDFLWLMRGIFSTGAFRGIILECVLLNCFKEKLPIPSCTSFPPTTNLENLTFGGLYSWKIRLCIPI